ncbi:OsmC family protein [Spirosoma gilvum]
MSASITSAFNQHDVVVQTNGTTKELSIATKPSGFGSAINGGELLLLSLATCFCNDIYREAGKRNIAVSGVEVTVSGEFGADGEPGYNFTYQAKVISDAPATEIDELIRHTDQIAEVHNTLRKGLNITLVTNLATN